MADHNTLIGSMGREIEGGPVMAGGVVREIESGMTLAGGVAREIVFAASSAPLIIEPVFADNTWEAIIYACQNKMVPDTWRVADSKPMTITGEDYQIDIIGKDHDDYADGSGKAPLTLQFHKCYGGKGYVMTASTTSPNVWETCKMRVSTLPEIKLTLPEVIRSAIRPVSKRTAAGNLDSTIKTNSEELFLLSEPEVFGAVHNSYGNEGSQYEYYATGGSVDKDLNGAKNGWWERSPRKSTSSSKSFCCIRDAAPGSLNGYNGAGTAPAFCF